MPSHLTEVCRAGSACPAALAHSSHTDVYRPEPSGSDNGFLDLLSSAQSLLLITIGALAVALCLAATWSSRRERRRGEPDAPDRRPPHSPEG